MLSFFVWVLLFYFLYKAIRFFFQYINSPMDSQGKNNNIKTKKADPKFQIKKEDIIDADFEEIKNPDNDKSKQTDN